MSFLSSLKSKLPLPPGERKIITLLTLLQFTHVIDFVIMMPLAPQFMRSFSITPQEFGLTVSAYTWASAICGFLGAFLLDRFDRKRALLFLYSGFVVGTGLCAIASTMMMLLMARIIAGGFAGVMSAVSYSIVADTVPNQRRGLAMGMLLTSFPLASVIGVPLGLKLASLWNWHMPFAVLAVIGIPMIMGIQFFIPSMRKHLETGLKSNPIREVKEILSDTQNYWAFSLLGIMFFGSFTLIPYLSAYLVGNLHMPEEDLFMIYLFGGALSFVTSQLIGRFADTHGKLKVFTIVAISSTIPVFLITHLPPSSIFIILCVSVPFMALTSGRMVPAMAIITGSIEPKKRGGFMSLVTTVNHAALGLASYLGGVWIEKLPTGELVRYDQLGLFAIAMTFASLYIVRRVRVLGT